MASGELEAFHRLIQLEVLPADQLYSPSKSKIGYYSSALREHLKQHPLDDPKAGGKGATAEEQLAALGKFAEGLLASPQPDRLPLLRAKAKELDANFLKDAELTRLLWRARRAADGTAAMLSTGDALSLTPTPWAWDGVLMARALNLLIALPKIGKTSLLLAMLAAWSRNDPAFLDRTLHGPCPPVLIVGTDQPEGDWARMLAQVGLLPDGRLAWPIVGLFHAGRPLHLDHEGIERIAAVAREHPGLLLIVDSLSACTVGLGIEETSAEIAEPVRDLMEAVAPYGTTSVVIHHSNKGRAGEGAAMASRGSTALPAVASQIIKLTRMVTKSEAPDPRIQLETTGRGGLPQHLLIERNLGGWISYGDPEAVMRAQRLAEKEQTLSDRQAEALEHVRERWSTNLPTEAKHVAEALEIKEDPARRVLDQLVGHGFLASKPVTGNGARRKTFWPFDGGLIPPLSPVTVGSVVTLGMTDESGVVRGCSNPSAPSAPTTSSDSYDSSDSPARQGGREKHAPTSAAFAPQAQGQPIEVMDPKTNQWVKGWRQITNGKGGTTVLCSSPRDESYQIERERIRPAA